LDRFAVINVQYQHLQDALRPMLRQFAAYPRSVNQVGPGMGSGTASVRMHLLVLAWGEASGVNQAT